MICLFLCYLTKYQKPCFLLYRQREKVWSKQPPFNFADKTIGVMGVGYLGGKAVDVLHQMGLNVIGWSNSEKVIPGIKHYAGEKEFDAFLSQTGVLICMLPLTSATRNILNRETFSRLPDGAFLINVGRGDHIVEQDLLDALSSGKLSGAALDVFQQKPLPVGHAFWGHPSIRVTPHIASVTNPKTAAPQVLENYLNMRAGRELMNRVDLVKGY
jgi:glyoxylate/hydroxypyruvate reductase A